MQQIEGAIGGNRKRRISEIDEDQAGIGSVSDACQGDGRRSTIEHVARRPGNRQLTGAAAIELWRLAPAIGSQQHTDRGSVRDARQPLRPGLIAPGDRQADREAAHRCREGNGRHRSTDLFGQHAQHDLVEPAAAMLPGDCGCEPAQGGKLRPHRLVMSRDRRRLPIEKGARRGAHKEPAEVLPDAFLFGGETEVHRLCDLPAHQVAFEPSAFRPIAFASSAALLRSPMPSSGTARLSPPRRSSGTYGVLRFVFWRLPGE